jgi:hypothetical protein
MSKMGNAIFNVQEDIIAMVNSGKSTEEIKEIIEEVHGSMFVGMVEEFTGEES